MISRSIIRRSARHGMSTEVPRRGAHTLEMAFIAPVAFVAICGVVELGRMWFVVHVLNECARGACRQAIAKGTGTVGNWSGDVTKAGQTRAAGLLGAQPSAINVVLYVDGSSSTDLSLASGAAPTTSGGFTPGSDIKVRITVNWNNVAWIPVQWLEGITLTCEARLYKE